MGISVGIDLGTTFSAVAYINPANNLPEIIPNREGKKLTPSVIQFLNGEVIFGSEAESAFQAGAANCAATFKRKMGDEEPYFIIDDKSYTSEELSAMLLRYLKEGAEETIGEPIDDAVITVPAYFYSKERAATERAAEAAGLKVKKLIDEPTAAAMTYGVNHWRENANILVYDLGGGTFDVTLVHMGKDGVLSAIVTEGDHILGGRDWDARIEDILVSKFEDETGISIREDHELLFSIKGMTEEVKKQLSRLEKKEVSLFIPDYGKASVTITKAEFEERTADLLERTKSLCEKVLEKAGLSINDITDVLLVGGSTRMPQIPAFLQELFHKRPLSSVNPDEAVALGAAIQTIQKEAVDTGLSVREVNGKKVTDRSGEGLTGKNVGLEKKIDPSGLVVRESTAHAMGVIAVDDENNRYYNEVIIPANHRRPVRAAKKFRFYYPQGENEFSIYVLQGDEENPMDCQIQAKYVVTGIKPVDRGKVIGTVIRIQYSYDKSGIIRVRARQEDSTEDLPIREESVPRDISMFGQPVSEGTEGGLNLGVKGGQGLVHKYKAITFSNVEWVKYDNIPFHESGAQFNEPAVHVTANEKEIKFEGYNISAMDEGVRYTIGPSDDFEIECDINTSTILLHPGGYLEISLGLISAHLTQDGGDILLDGNRVANVGPEFHLKMSLTNGGEYDVEINHRKVGNKFQASTNDIDVRFGFVHDSHYCCKRSLASISNILMTQATAGQGEEGDDSPDTETWD